MSGGSDDRADGGTGETDGDRRPAIVIAATPTSNGGLHVGHLAGPYLAADVCARHLRATGRRVISTTCTDDSQSYVVTTAHRRGVTPEQLCRTGTAEVQRSLDALGVCMAGLPPIDDRYRRTVLRFMTDLHRDGRLRLRTVRLPYAVRAGVFLYDGLLSGTCPVCLGGSSGGVCEACGHPNHYDQLLDAHYSLDPDDPVEYREQQILVLPMEEYRERLTAYYAAHTPHWRPRPRRLISELLARPLPDVPVTIPGTWGIPAPFAETPGQILYPWIEAMPAVIYSTAWTAEQLGEPAEDTDRHFTAEADPQLVYFHGYDNVYHWGLVDLVALMAHGERYALPEANVCNEFYALEGEKFSTSRNHLVEAVDLLTRVPRDLVRYYLSLTAPESQGTNFTEPELHRTVTERLVGPWNRLADAVARRLPDDGAALPTTPGGRHRAGLIAERFRLCYRISDFSPSQAADTIAVQLLRLERQADTADLGDLLLELRTLLSHAAPILVDAAEKLTASGVDLGLQGHDDPSVAVFRLPHLPGSALRPDQALEGERA
ncbi:class I tRNA ligase family protein [Streptacidiphilus griseoplanus]|uniref:class I tRNA ligase family protein n=1 Tax=Peterkaempfera griseoplana TaxID=66896 RepID=UPI0006E3A2E5|nr:class I tRNA ligase family protein [Peterkaempfera griseoplana]